MAQMETANLVQLVFADLETEFATTRRLLERVKTEHFGFKPHEKSFALGALAQHVASLPSFIEIIAKQPDYDLAGWVQQPEPTSAEEIRAQFEKTSAAATAALKNLAVEDLTEPWTLRAGETVYFTLPKGVTIRSFGVSHLIHHRAQLTVYLRLLNEPVPGLYGPSADEK